jgi:hypothetical protein
MSVATAAASRVLTAWTGATINDRSARDLEAEPPRTMRPPRSTEPTVSHAIVPRSRYGSGPIGKPSTLVAAVP